MTRISLSRRQIQDGLVVLALFATLGTTFFARLPSSADYLALLAGAGLIAVCSRFPILLRHSELTLAHAIGISILFAFGLAWAAWTMLIGLLLGELWWFFVPGAPAAPDRPPRLSRFTAVLAQQMVPLLVAGGADSVLARQFPVDADARSAIALSLFTLIYLVTYNILLALDMNSGPGTVPRFFRENIGAVAVVELLPLPLVIFAALNSRVFGSSLVLIIGGVLSVLALRLHKTSWTLLNLAQTLVESQKNADLAQQRADNLNRQLTVSSAKLELAQHDASALTERARRFEALARVDNLIRAAAGSRLPFDALIREIAEAVGSQIGQIGLVIVNSNNLTFTASFGLSPERATLERNTVWLQDHGLSGRALRQGRAARVGNVAADPDYLEQYPGIRSEMCIPFVVGERRLGIIRLLSRHADAFSSDDEAFATQAADLITLALENARLLDEARMRQKEHAILYDTGVKLAANLDIRTVYRAIVQKMAEAVNADICTLAEFDWTSGMMRLTEPRSPTAYAVKDYPSVARAVSEQKPIVVQAATPDLAPTDLERLRAENASTVAVIPMVHASQVTGVVHLYSLAAREYTASDLYVAQVLANQSAVALQNARLFHHVTEGRDRLAAILDSTREGVLVIDATGLVSLINPPLEDFWGIPSHKLLNQHLLSLLDQPDLNIANKLGFRRDEVEELLLTLRAGLALSIPKAQYPLYSPKLRFLERSGAPVLDQFAKAIGWVVILRDVTEERELQHVRDTLANMIVHDLRSPLTSMLAGVSLIRDRLPREHQTALIKQSIDVAIRSGNKMLDLVNTLLDLARMESGEITLKRTLLELGGVVDEVMSDLTPLANDQGVVLINDISPGIPGVPADREKLIRVFTNLLDNALKFSPPGGQVTVCADAHPNGEVPPVVTCGVLDTGPGIPEEYRGRIFDRFVQVEGLSSRRQGTGLGLAFCKMAVEAHGGQIWVENRPEGGSAFYFTLPLDTVVLEEGEG